MTEADADQFRIAAAGTSKKSHEVVDPTLAIINSGGGAGYHVSLAVGD
jgi:hypothetical protein